MYLDKFQDECGLMGVWGHPEASNLTYLGLYAQQHRGQEGAGVVSLSRFSSDSKRLVEPQFHSHRALGLVADIFCDFDFSKLAGDCAIGHVRYTTAGGNLLANVQPFYAQVSVGKVALAHNGNLINADSLREELIKAGAIFSASSDTEVIMHLLALGLKNLPVQVSKPGAKNSSRGSSKARVAAGLPLIEKVIAALQQVSGAYSLLLLFEDRLLAIRDPHGLRPLALGDLNGFPVVASETCAFDLVGARYVRDIAPGEILEISGGGATPIHTQSYFPFGRVKESPCIFEYVYFARPDSRVFGQNVYRIRKQMGHELAREKPVKADIVVPVPDSGMTAALGYSEESGIPLEMGLIRNHYVGRTFIEPKQAIRDFGVKIKLNANPDVLAGKSVIVIDDSIVRGTTSKKLVQMLRQAGARELHMRISAPPTRDPCYYGIDTPSKGELIASQKSIEEIREYLGVESLAYLSIEGLYRAVNSQEGKFCDACFTGKYPIGTPADFEDRQEPLFTIRKNNTAAVEVTLPKSHP